MLIYSILMQCFQLFCCVISSSLVLLVRDATLDVITLCSVTVFIVLVGPRILFGHIMLQCHRVASPWKVYLVFTA